MKRSVAIFALFAAATFSARLNAQCPTSDDAFYRLTPSMCPHLNGTFRASWNPATTVSSPVYEVALYTAGGYCADLHEIWRAETTQTSLELPIPSDVVYEFDVRIKGCPTAHGVRNQVCGVADTFRKAPSAGAIKSLARVESGAVELRARRSEDFRSFGPNGLVQRPDGTVVNLGNPSTTNNKWCEPGTTFTWTDYGGNSPRDAQKPPVRLAPGSHRYWLTAINSKTGFSVLRGASSASREIVIPGSIEPDPAIELSPSTGILLGTSIRFRDVSTGTVAWRRWDFDGDGSTDATEKDVEYSYPRPGTYRVSLRVSGAGVTRTTHADVIVTDPNPQVTLTTIDPNPVWGGGLVSKGELVSDPVVLASGGREVSRVAVDGVTRLLLRATTNSATVFRFRLVTGTNVGTLQTPAGVSGESVDVSTVELTPGVHIATAIWVPPAHIGQNVSGASRPVEFEVTRDATNVKRVQLHLLRPPVVLVHGLWSDAATWRNFPLTTDTRFRTSAIDYQSTNASAFSVNVPRLDAIVHIIRAMRLEGVAVARADVVAHSMGGILARLWSAQSSSVTEENYRTGYIRKLVTLDTPHLGSPLATELVDMRDQLLSSLDPELTVGGLLALYKMPLGGAVDDLIPGSEALRKLTSSPPTHAFVGVGASEDCSSASNLIATIASPDTVFGEEANDLIVGAASQRAGLPNGATTVIGGRDGVHLCNTSSAWYSDEVTALLDYGSGFTTTQAVPSQDAIRFVPRSFAGVPVDVSLAVSSASAAPGELVRGTFTISNHEHLESVAIVGEGTFLPLEKGATEFELAIPPDAAPGVINLRAMAVSDGVPAASPSQSVSITGPALVALDLLPRSVIASRATPAGVAAIAIFDNGASRRLTPEEVQFAMIDPAIAEVDADGTVRGITPGETELQITAGSLSLRAPVRVVGVPAAGRRRAARH